MSQMKRKVYEAALEPLQVQLVEMARWIRHSGARVVVVMEGRDTAGKDGVIEAIEDPRRRFCLGVQWHPEYRISPGDTALVEAFVRAAACR